MNKPIYVGSLLAALVVGGAGMWAWQQHHLPVAQEVNAAITVPTPDKLLAQPLQNQVQPLSGQSDPFTALEQMQQQAMAEMHQQMQAIFNHDNFFSRGGMASNFGSMFSPSLGVVGTDIQQGEDDHSVFYKMQVGDQDLSNLNVKVENGYVSINAELSDKSANAYSRSTVAETFPVPAGVDPDSAKVEKQDKSIVIRFDKVS